MRSVFLIILCTIVLIGCEIDRSKVKFGKSKGKDAEFSLTKEDLCNLLKYNDDGQTGYLITKGFTEDKNQVPYFWAFDNQCAIFQKEGVGRIIISTDYSSNNKGTYYLVFDGSQRNTYEKLVNQFTEISTPFPTREDNADTTKVFHQKISEKCGVQVWGYNRLSEGYTLVIYPPE